jgi:hypothetical protein
MNNDPLKAVSVSLGGSARDKQVEVELLGKTVIMERRGTDGDAARATALFTALDGRVDALGVGGIDLWVELAGKRYPLHAAQKLVRGVQRTPVVDGTGLKNTLERSVASCLVAQLGQSYAQARVMLTAAVDRYGMTLSFFEAGYDVVCADLMFGLGIPIPIYTLKGLKRLGAAALPLVGRFPISMIYPTGEKQDQIVPRFEKWYAWADIIAGDCHYIKRHMPDDLDGKIIVTNTTTESDMKAFRARGVKHVMTTTPRIEGRSFGTNMLEAALTAVADKQRPLEREELSALLNQLNIEPTVHSF